MVVFARVRRCYERTIQWKRLPDKAWRHNVWDVYFSAKPNVLDLGDLCYLQLLFVEDEVFSASNSALNLSLCHQQNNPEIWK